MPPLLIFYVFVAYIFTSFSWWTYLHLEKNEQLFTDRKLLMEMLYKQEGRPIEQISSSSEYHRLQSEFLAKNRMIYGEATVFCFLLILVVMRVRAGLKKEIMLNQQQRNFLLSITHELKSPIAGIQLTLETLVKHIHKLEPEKSSKLIQNSLNEAERLSDLVERLLTASKLEENSFVLLSESIYLNELIQQEIERINHRKGLTSKCIWNEHTQLYINGDSLAWQTIISNLLDNALKYTKDDEPIQVNLYMKNNHYFLEVCDRGKGIESQEKKNIFKKFYRIGNEDTRNTKGTGLGLFIVKQLVELHHSSIEVLDNIPTGTKFIISISNRIIDK